MSGTTPASTIQAEATRRLRRVAIIGHYPADPGRPRGGIEASVLGLTRTLGALRPDCEIRVWSLGHTKGESALPGHSGSRVRFLTYPAGREIAAPLRLPGLIAALERYAPDVVHLHGTGPLAALLGVYLTLRRKPWVLTVHGLLVKELADAYIRAPSLKRRLQRWIYSAFERLAMRSAKQMIVDTPYVARAIGPAFSARIHTIAQGVFLDELAAAMTLDRHRSHAIVSIGVMHPRKGHHHLIRAFAKAVDGLPECRLTIFGAEIDPDYTAGLRDLVHQFGLDHAVQVHTDAGRQDLLEAIAGARIMALHSEEESQGIALCEALAAGLPVVSTEAGGIPDVVQHEVDGLLSPYGDVDGFARNLHRLLTDDGLLTRFSEAALARRERSGWDVAVNDALAVYEAAAFIPAGATAPHPPPTS
ncbi:MAG TPA: glycosyltransferase family 4 protein [Stellaceae bacterium]|nr:glycosyltransferase family 4 protein [Stellaceae bacterium]